MDNKEHVVERLDVVLTIQRSNAHSRQSSTLQGEGERNERVKERDLPSLF